MLNINIRVNIRVIERFGMRIGLKITATNNGYPFFNFVTRINKRLDTYNFILRFTK